MEGENIKNLFVIAALDKAKQLKKNSPSFSVIKFVDKGEETVDLVLSGKKQKRFSLTFKDKVFFLENPEEKKPGGRPTFMMDDMVTYLFILVNGGEEIPGLLLSPETEEEQFQRSSPIIPT